MLSMEQRLLRQSGIGASEIGAILGVNKYQTALEVYHNKVNPLPEDDTLSGNEKILWGNLLEPVIAEQYSDRMKCKLLESSTVRHPQYPFLLCTPDRLIPNTKKGVEIKTVGHNAREQWDDNQIPKSYFMQVQHCMLVMDYDEWDLAALFEGQELKIFNFKRDRDFDKIIIDAASDFWNNYVVPRVEPAMDYAHPNALQILKKIYDDVLPKAEIDLTDSIEHWVKTWLEAKEQVSKYTWAANSAQAHLLGALGVNEIGHLPNGETLVRKKIKKKGYFVEPSEYITLSHRKAK